MSLPAPEVDALLEEANQLVHDYRACAPRVAHEDALRILHAVDAAVTAAERARRRFSAESHDQARRALLRARGLIVEARRRPPQD
jgi:hypothetical protein